MKTYSYDRNGFVEGELTFKDSPFGDQSEPYFNLAMMQLGYMP